MTLSEHNNVVVVFSFPVQLKGEFKEWHFQCSHTFIYIYEVKAKATGWCIHKQTLPSINTNYSRMKCFSNVYTRSKNIIFFPPPPPPLFHVHVHTNYVTWFCSVPYFPYMWYDTIFFLIMTGRGRGKNEIKIAASEKKKKKSQNISSFCGMHACHVDEQWQERGSR